MSLSPPRYGRPSTGSTQSQSVSLAPDNGLQCSFGGVGYDFGVTAIVALEQAENDGLAIRAAPTLATYMSGTEPGFIGLNLSAQRRAFKTPLAHAFSDVQVDVVDQAHRNTG